MGDPVIAVSDITRRYGAKTALSNVVSPPRGGVYGLVGANGAGKTTLIKHTGLLRPQSTACVFGLDPVADPVGVLSRIGYRGARPPTWMRVDELMNYSRAPSRRMSPTPPSCAGFGLDGHARISTLSKGQKARVGLLAALAHRPEFARRTVVRTRPVVRRDIVEAIMRTIAHEGRTVLFSSHLLDEVERTADHVTMINEGRVVLSGPLVELKRAHGNASLDDIFAAHAGTRLTTQ